MLKTRQFLSVGKESMSTTSTPTRTPSRLIRRPEVQGLTGLPKSTLYGYVATGDFPAPVRLGPGQSARSVAWSLGAVLDWIESRQSARPSTSKAA